MPSPPRHQPPPQHPLTGCKLRGSSPPSSVTTQHLDSCDVLIQSSGRASYLLVRSTFSHLKPRRPRPSLSTLFYLAPSKPLETLSSSPSITLSERFLPSRVVYFSHSHLLLCCHHLLPLFQRPSVLSSCPPLHRRRLLPTGAFALLFFLSNRSLFPSCFSILILILLLSNFAGQDVFSNGNHVAKH